MADAGTAGPGPDPVLATDGEEAPFDFEQTFEEVKQKPCKVKALGVDGLKRTKKGIVLRELVRVANASTLDEIKDTLLAAYEDLMDLDIFDAVEIVVDADSEVRAAAPAGRWALGARPDGRPASQPYRQGCRWSLDSTWENAMNAFLPPMLQGRDDKCSVKAKFQEKSVLRLHTGTYVQGTEGM
jgi:hypothetical protein